MIFNSNDDSPFMRLPTEVREMIYRPLLVAKYTSRERNMRSREFDEDRSRILYSKLDQTYDFHPAILRTNRKIYEEARDVCRRENDFVCLTSLRPSRLGNELQSHGLHMLATTTKAQDFWNVSMWITLDPVDKAGWPPCLSQGWDSRDRDDVSKDGRTWNYIFSRDDLPTFCKFIVTRGWDGPMFDLRDTIIYIDINPAIITYIHGDVWEALRQLREAGMFLVACNWKAKGDRLLRNGRSDLATTKYEAALLKVEAIRQHRDLDCMINTGTFKDYDAIDGINVLTFRTYAGMAASLLMSRKYKDVIELTDVALQRNQYRQGALDHCYMQDYLCDGYDWALDQRFDYAGIHYCHAISLKKRGDTSGAVEHMEKAVEYDPGDGQAFEQLQILKRKQEREPATKTKKLNTPQIQPLEKPGVYEWKVRG